MYQSNQFIYQFIYCHFFSCMSYFLLISESIKRELRNLSERKVLKRMINEGMILENKVSLNAIEKKIVFF